MFYVCLKTSNGFRTLSVFNDEKNAKHHRLEWYMMNNQYFFKVLKKSPDNANNDLFTPPCNVSLLPERKQNSKVIIENTEISINPKTKYKKSNKQFQSHIFNPEDEYKTQSKIPNRLKGFLLDEDKGLCYIYGIHCRYNGRIYVGKTKALYTRSYYHLSKLRRRSHDNKDLQTDFIRWKEHNFTMQIIDTCPESELADLEIEYIHKYSYRAYNLASNPSKRKTS